MRTKILELAQEIDKELEEREKHKKELEARLIEQNSRIYQLEDYAGYLEEQINKEKPKGAMRHKCSSNLYRGSNRKIDLHHLRQTALVKTGPNLCLDRSGPPQISTYRGTYEYLIL